MPLMTTLLGIVGVVVIGDVLLAEVVGFVSGALVMLVLVARWVDARGFWRGKARAYAVWALSMEHPAIFPPRWTQKSKVWPRHLQLVQRALWSGLSDCVRRVTD
jgi:hypothetical protein